MNYQEFVLDHKQVGECVAVIVKVVVNRDVSFMVKKMDYNKLKTDIMFTDKELSKATDFFAKIPIG